MPNWVRLGQIFLEIMSGNHFHNNQNGRHDLGNQVKDTVIELVLKVVQMHFILNCVNI